MLGRLRTLLSTGRGTAEAPGEAAPATARAPGGATFDLAAHLDRSAAVPVVHWEAVERWIEALPEAQRATAWAACERAWLLHVRDALGPAYRLDESLHVMVVSSLAPRQARHALDFMERTLRRIVHVLDGVAEVPPFGKDLLILFDDADAYYQYVSIYHPESGEFALSSGMHINRGCSHYVSTKADLAALEPVIAHEMTHGCVAHLPLPLWVNEGLAVNTEHRVAGAGMPLHTPLEMRTRHLKFWGPTEVQEFWSGKSFRRPDEGNELSYDLARILVDQLSAQWPSFAAFARGASYEDGGAAAAREHLALDLGAVAAALFDREDAETLQPDPSLWLEPIEHAPERGRRYALR